MARKWDDNWDRLKLETKIERLRYRLIDVENKAECDANSAHSAASAALYVANLNR